jgi:formylglycine-generating enzyme required for sulfatase activity
MLRHLMRYTIPIAASLAFFTSGTVAQSGRSMRLLSPAVIGQPLAIAMQHPTAAAGNLYLLLWCAPTSSMVTMPQVPGLQLNGLLRVDLATTVVAFAAVLDASGQSPVLAGILPAAPGLVGYTFDVQGTDLDANATLTLSDDELAIAVSAPPSSSLNLQRIDAGTYAMGSTAGQPNETPVHAVTISRPFWIGRFEVTQAEYQSLMGSNPSLFIGSNRPVERVTWNQAVAYCAALTSQEAAAGRLPTGYQYRLPTEAEWEYSCRAGTASEWNTGNALACTDANFFDGINYCVPGPQFGGQTVAVGTFPSNALGLAEMHGNVFEWCLDAWDGSANYPATAVVDPFVTQGPDRIVRGGSWNVLDQLCRSASRGASNPGTAIGRLGFRIVCGPILL